MWLKYIKFSPFITNSMSGKTTRQGRPRETALGLSFRLIEDDKARKAKVLAAKAAARAEKARAAAAAAQAEQELAAQKAAEQLPRYREWLERIGEEMRLVTGDEDDKLLAAQRIAQEKAEAEKMRWADNIRTKEANIRLDQVRVRSGELVKFLTYSSLRFGINGER
jgi:hypothetical protein